MTYSYDDLKLIVEAVKTYGKYSEEYHRIIHIKHPLYNPEFYEEVLSYIGKTDDDISTELYQQRRDGQKQKFYSDYKYALYLAAEKEKQEFEQQNPSSTRYGNSHMQGAKIRQDDEYYIPYNHAVNILNGFAQFLSGKRILCNCDYPTKSKTYQASKDNFTRLNLRSVTAIGMTKDAPACMQTYDANGESDLIPVQNGGDFRIGESVAELDKCDVVISNPPFSKDDDHDKNKFDEYIKLLMKHKKDFISIGPTHAVGYVDLQQYFRTTYNTGKKVYIVKSPFNKFERPEKTAAQLQIDKATGKTDDTDVEVSIFTTFECDPFGKEIEFNDQLQLKDLKTVQSDEYDPLPIALNNSIVNSIPRIATPIPNLGKWSQNMIVVPFSILHKRVYDHFDIDGTFKKLFIDEKEKMFGVVLKYKPEFIQN